MAQEIKIRTWWCPSCGYRQDYEPTKENHDLHFKDEQVAIGTPLSAGDCPSCVLGLNAQRTKRKGTLVRAPLERRMVHRVFTEAEIDADVDARIDDAVLAKHIAIAEREIETAEDAQASRFSNGERLRRLAVNIQSRQLAIRSEQAAAKQGAAALRASLKTQRQRDILASLAIQDEGTDA